MKHAHTNSKNGEQRENTIHQCTGVGYQQLLRVHVQCSHKQFRGRVAAPDNDHHRQDYPNNAPGQMSKNIVKQDIKVMPITNVLYI